MPTGFAARVNDPTAHGDPLNPGPGSTDVLIGSLPAWRGIGAAQLAALMAAISDGAKAIAKASAAAAAAKGTAAAPAADANLVKTAAEAVKNVVGAIAASGADMHRCSVIKLLVPDGPGVVTTGSQTVLINNLPACRVGDTIQELTSVNLIAGGCTSVIIGG
jgi:uncharacterized Zn-binding protein involved in type VI secretion